MDVKQEINPKNIYIYLTSLFFYAALSEASEKMTLMSHPGARGRYRHNGLRMNAAQDVTDISYRHMYGLISYAQTDQEKVKGLLIKINVIKGFSAKSKVLKDCNQIKGF